MRRGISLAACALLAAASLGAQQPAAAQPGPWNPEWGDWSVSFQLPSGGVTGFGVWRQVGSRTALGLAADGALLVGRGGEDGAGEERREMAVSVGPVLKRYGRNAGPVLPFFVAQAAGSWAIAGVSGEPTRSQYGGAVGLGLGAEWFPARGVGIGGHTGVRASYTVFDDDGPGQPLTTLRVRLLTSALSLQLYF